MASVFLNAEWRSLVMLNYTIDRALLAPWLPPGVELDLWQDEAVVSMIGFLFCDCRVLGVPVPGHRNFEEVNLRFYVRRHVGAEVRRGVVFVKEIVPKPAIALVARMLYNERYVAMPMRHSIDCARLEYAWRHRGAWQWLAAHTRGSAAPMMPGGEEEFIFEHYWGYSRQRDGGTVEYAVEHPSWRVWQTNEAELECDVAALYGAAFVPALGVEPHSAFVAEGSAVQVRRGVRIA
jgi:uncharacterized protein YqjF (DUF2071 family)